MVCTAVHAMLIPQLLCTAALQRGWVQHPSPAPPGAVWKLFARCQLKTGKGVSSLCSCLKALKDSLLWQKVGIFKLMKQRTEGQWI